MIIILGFIICELTTVMGSIEIFIKSTNNLAIDFADKGYKIDKYYLEWKQKDELNNSKKNNLPFGLLMIPGINMIKSYLLAKKSKNDMENEIKMKNALIPLTEKEKQVYKNLKSKKDKCMFTTISIGLNESQEIIKYDGNDFIICDHKLCSLKFDMLPALNYDIDEVKRLNQATGYSYKIGIVDNIYTAIIGIPNFEFEIDKIQFKSEDNKIIHKFVPLDEEEAKDKKFVVYPYSSISENKALKQIIENIKRKKDNSYTFKENSKIIPYPTKISNNPKQLVKKNNYLH